ncbi:MAG TPA: hypothetical protein VFC67_26980 [Prolixibacteraceae bacterium]|nr:hypothetical protein [Prolixibacteraceae bacterium]
MENVISNVKTTFNYLLNNPEEDQIVILDKAKAINDGIYSPCGLDKKYNNKGSIICKKFAIISDSVIINIILSINTYGKPLCDKNDMDSLKKIEVMILPMFYMRYMLELELYFIRFYQDTKCTKCKGIILGDN